MKEDRKLAKWLAGEMDEKELREFESLPEFDTYNKIKQYSAQLTVSETDTDALYNRIITQRNADNKKVVRLRSPWLVRIAAILVIALGLTFLYHTTSSTTQVAEAGERTEFLLPDNSSVVLNAGSEAEYKSWNWNKKRSVELEGEAFFKVAKGKTFDVNTSLGKVTVVGTQFNVKARGSRFDVTCFEGKVKVTYNSQEVFLSPGENVTFEDGEKIMIPETTAVQPGWINNEVNFESEKLANVIKEFERQYNIKIQANNVPLEETFTGSLPTNNLDRALDMLTTTANLKAVKSGKGAVILSAE